MIEMTLLKGRCRTGPALFVLLFAAGSLLGRGTEAVSLSLEEANRRWAGAACTLRLPIEIAGREASGRAGSQWRSPWGLYTVHPITGRVGCPNCAPGELPFSYALVVSDRAALARLMRGQAIPAGVELVVEGWRATAADRGFLLALRFRDAPVEAQFHFATTAQDRKKGMSWDRLAQIESFLRTEILQLAAADEQLVPLQGAVPAAEEDSAEALAPAIAAPTDLAGAYAPEVRIEAVSVNPPRFQAGAEVELIVTFTLSGLPPGAPFELTVEHEIWQEEARLASLPEKVTYRAGTHTNSRTVRSDPAQAPGLYTLRTTVTLAGVSASGTALFAVD